MSLEDEIHEWRKQLVEKLLLNGVKPEDLEAQVIVAKSLIYGNRVATVTIECPLRFAGERNTTLLEVSQKNGCLVMARG